MCFNNNSTALFYVYRSHFDDLIETVREGNLTDVDCGGNLPDSDFALADTCSFWLEGVVLVGDE
jgi:hypothetical protein